MTPGTTHTLAGIPVVVAEAHCACGKALVLLQLPGTKLTQHDVACGGCVGAARRGAA